MVINTAKEVHGKKSENMNSDWQIRKLCEVCEIINGGTPKTSVLEYWNGKHLWITPAEMGKRYSPFVGDTERKISDLGLKDSSAQLLPPYSVILSSRAPIGHLVINTAPMATNQGCKGLVPKNGLNSKYLYYYLGSIVGHLNALGTGATFKEISAGKLGEVTIPIPSVSEQKRIVSALDEVFEKTAKAKENAEKNLQNAREIFESYLQSIFINPGDDWEERSIQDICVEIFAGGDAPKDNFSKEKSEKYKIPIFANAVKDNGLYGFTDYARVTEPAITTAARGSGTGHTEIRNEAFLPIVRLIVLIPNLSLVTLEFLKHSIDNLEIARSGSAIPQLTVPMIKDYKLPLPPLSEQRAIVRKLDTLLAETKNLKRIYEQKLTDLEELKKSILQKAVNGELAGAKA